MSNNIAFRKAVVLVLQASLAIGSTIAIAADASLRAELERVAARRILFGHQSVGANVIDGVKQFAQNEGVPLHIVEVQTASQVAPATFGHVYLAENGKPNKKLESFELAMEGQSADPDIAFLKFCYVDFSAETNATALFAQYRAAVDRVKIKHPGTTFVHVTAPLTSAQSGVKEVIKRLLGRAGSAQNVRREEYNSLIRNTYQGREPIFDLARLESIAPDGTLVTEKWNGTIVPSMAPQYTDDGGHLNNVGKIRAARELIFVLAAVPDRTTPSSRTRSH
jgi:hypothetical protein